MDALGRPNLVVLDNGAFARNLALVRQILPEGTGIFQVCKGDGYGLGTTRAARLGLAAGLSQFCVGTPEEAIDMRRAFPEAEILLFPSAAPQDLHRLAAMGVTLTVHSLASLQAVLESAPHARLWLKVDTGLHRFGFDSDTWPEVLSALRSGALKNAMGVYTHFSQSSDPDRTNRSLALFEHFLSVANQAAGRRLTSMVAASPTLLVRPDLPYDYVDPGRALYGMLGPDEAGGRRLEPVVCTISSRLIDSRTLRSGEAETLGYAGAVNGQVSCVGTMPLGHFDGLPTGATLGSVFIQGVELRVLARTLLSSIIDLSPLPTAQVGDEIVLVGQSEGRVRDIHGFATSLNTTATMIHFGLIRNLPKVFSQETRNVGI